MAGVSGAREREEERSWGRLRTPRQSLEAPEMALPAGVLTLGSMKGLVTEG